MFEILESRRLMSVSLVGGVLTIDGTAGADVLNVQQFNATTLRTQDNGVVQFFADSAVNSIVINGAAGNDSLTVGPNVNENVTENGGDGNDVLDGGAGNDTLNGGAGNDNMWGDFGNDTFDGGTGADNMVGGSGTDTATYASRAVGVTVSLDNAANDGQAGEGDNVSATTENVIGGNGNDTISGTNGVASVFNGGNGNDRLFGFSAADTLIGGNGNDQLVGNGSNDLLLGGAGNDLIYGGSGNDNIHGGDNDDTLIGGSGRDFLFGQNGNDFLFAQGDPVGGGAAFNDVLDGGAGFDFGERDGADTNAGLEILFIS